MIIIEFVTDGVQLAEANGVQPKLTAGSAGSARARFLTDAAWSGMALTAVFHKGNTDILMPLTHGECDFPCEMTAACGSVQVGLFGTDGTRTLTSVFCPVRIWPGVPTDGEQAQNYTPGLYEQFAAKFSRFENMTATAERGEDASVALTAGDAGVCLHFTLPKGDKGADGKDGAPGKDGADGKDGAPGADGKDGADYVLTEEDKKEIAASITGVARIVYIDTESGLAVAGKSSGVLHFHEYVENFFGSPEYEAGALSGYVFKAVHNNRIIDLVADGSHFGFSGYDAETDTFLKGELQEGIVLFTVTENYMLSKFAAAISGGAW